MNKQPRFFSNVPGADKKVFYYKYKGPKDPNSKGVECIDPYDNTVYDVGDVWSNPDQCNRKTCQKDGTVMEERCLDDLEFPKECKEITAMEFLNLDYPWCCPRVACPGDEFYVPDENDWSQFCFDKNNVRELGEQWTDKGKCNLKTCKRNYKVHVEKCPKYKIPRGCSLTDPDLTKEFPQCCPTVTCPPGKGPQDGKFELVKKVERPVSVEEWADLFTTTSERITHPDGIKPREDYDQSEEKTKNTQQNELLPNTKEIKTIKKLKESEIEGVPPVTHAVLKQRRRLKQKN